MEAYLISLLALHYTLLSRCNRLITDTITFQLQIVHLACMQAKTRPSALIAQTSLNLAMWVKRLNGTQQHQKSLEHHSMTGLRRRRKFQTDTFQGNSSFLTIMKKCTLSTSTSVKCLCTSDGNVKKKNTNAQIQKWNRNGMFFKIFHIKCCIVTDRPGVSNRETYLAVCSLWA